MKRFSFALLALIMGAFFITSCDKDNGDDDEVEVANTYKIGTTVYTIDHDNATVTVKDFGQGTGDKIWTKDTTWILDGLVFVNAGQTLEIEAGTVVKGKPGQERDASALVVARGAKIMAEGTASEPIIFTAEADPLDGTLAVTERGMWGGVIVLGAARLNSAPGITNIEGIDTSEPRGSYGGSNDEDNSGTLKYISIRHGGTDIGEGNEINGLTLGGVGSGTVIDYVEVIANKDDGIEFFGGVPQVKHAVVAYCGDDSYDYDEGFRGKGQFWLTIQDNAAGDRMGEHDGGTKPETAEPYAIPVVYNATYIGRGADAGKRVITFRDNAGGHYVNSIFANQAKGIDIEMLITEQNSYKQMEAGNLFIKNCIFSDIADATAAGIFKLSFSGDSLDTNDEPVKDDDGDQLATHALQQKMAEGTPVFQAKFDTWSNTAATGVVSAENPVPDAGTADGGVAPEDAWFDNVTYQGAFEPGGSNWAAGWTLLFGAK